jgi:hypothetical protein
MRESLYSFKLMAAAALALTALVFVPVSSEGVTVKFDLPDRHAYQIKELDIGGTFYDVAFIIDSAYGLYGPLPGLFRFTDASSA